MPYFTRGVPKDKLSILYFLRSINAALTREQLYRAMVENDCMSFFTFQTVMLEMEQDRLLIAVPRSFGQAYSLCPDGEQALTLFGETLPESLRRQLDEYANEHRAEFLRECRLTAAMEELQGGAYRVTLRAQDRSQVKAELTLTLSDRNAANRVREAWQNRAEEICMSLLTDLLRE